MVSLPDGISQCLSVGNPRQMKQDGKDSISLIYQETPCVDTQKFNQRALRDPKSRQDRRQEGKQRPKAFMRIDQCGTTAGSGPKLIYTAQDLAQMFLLVLARSCKMSADFPLLKSGAEFGCPCL